MITYAYLEERESMFAILGRCWCLGVNYKFEEGGGCGGNG